MVYFVTFDLTVIIVPKPFRAILGYSVDIGKAKKYAYCVSGFVQVQNLVSMK